MTAAASLPHISQSTEWSRRARKLSRLMAPPKVNLRICRSPRGRSPGAARGHPTDLSSPGKRRKEGSGSRPGFYCPPSVAADLPGWQCLSIPEDHVERQPVVLQPLLVRDGELQRRTGDDVLAELVPRPERQRHVALALAGRGAEVDQVGTLGP